MRLGLGVGLVRPLVKIVQRWSDGWLKDNLDESRLDNFYWILTGINGVNLLVFLWVAWRYKGRNAGNGSSVTDESVMMELKGNVVLGEAK